MWAHVAEFIPYWVDEARLVVERGRREPEPFGRTKTDPARLAAIERDRSTDQGRLWARTERDIATLRAFLSGLTEVGVGRPWAHPTLGTMDLAHIVDEFLVGHLEQHATQLDELRHASPPGRP